MSERQVIDMHCDTLLECYTRGFSLRDGPMQINAEKLSKGGALAQCFAIFVVSNEAAKRNHIELSPYDFYRKMVSLYKTEIAKNADLLAPALCVRDIVKNKELGLISSILTIEDGVAIENKLERIKEFFMDGVRMISLTWNYENSIGYPNSAVSAFHSKGLKRFGFEVVERMNEFGMIVDVSHLSEGGFDDVAQISRKPFIASHSCARTLGSHQRNLTDRQLKVLGEKGGIVGINFCAEFLEDGSDFSSINNIVKHLVYIKDKAGMDALAWGSDFDGIDGSILEYVDYTGFSLILDKLSRYFSDDEIDQINTKNFLRVMKDNVGY